MEEEKQLEIKRDTMYSEWKRFWDFWYNHTTLEMNEALTVYFMQQKQ